MSDERHAQYVEADKGARLIHFAFYAAWAATVLICKWLFEQKSGGKLALRDVLTASVWYWVVPMSFFLLVQASYFFWIGMRTVRARIYPPPATKMPGRTKVRTGGAALFMASGCFAASVLDLMVILMLSLSLIMPLVYREPWYRKFVEPMFSSAVREKCPACVHKPN